MTVTLDHPLHSPGEIDFIDPESVFGALQPIDEGLPPPVRLLDSAWLIARAELLESTRTHPSPRPLTRLAAAH